MTDLFAGDKAQGQEPDQGDLANPFDTLVGEGKKFKSKEDLAMAKLHSDAHIARLEQEAADFRKRLDESMTMQEFIDKMNKEDASNPDPQDPGERSDPAVNVPKPTDVESVARKIYNEEQQKAAALKNQETVVNELRKAWGNDYVARLEARTAELGLDKSKVNELAASAPKALITMMIPARTSVPEFTPPRSSVVTSTHAPSGTRNKAYYDQMKKQNPDMYKSDRITKQRHDDAIKMGPAYFN